MERIETAGRRVAPVHRRPRLTPVSVCQAIHDAPYRLARLVRRGVHAVGYWVAWTWDAVVTDQKQMYHEFLRSRFVGRCRALCHAPVLVGFAAAMRDNWLVRLTAMTALTAAIFVGISLAPAAPTLDAICILVTGSGPQVVSQDTAELDRDYLSLRRSLGGSHTMQYILQPGRTVTVHHNDRTVTAVSQGERLPVFLDRCGIRLGSDEMVELDLTGDELSLRISSTLTYQHFVTVETDYAVERTPDPLMDKGTETVIRKGVSGHIVETYEDTVVRGEVVSTRYVGASHDTSHAELIRYGTRVYEVARDDTIDRVVPNADGEGGILYFKSGDTMTYSKVMACSSTAYYSGGDGGAAWTTAVGASVGIGTIAVDPTVIPYYTKMFIQTTNGSRVYGMGTALDCGGAIKGNIVDLWFPSYADCRSWGRRAVTVYILDKKAS